MPEYEVSERARQDLQGIARYTAKTWGKDQAKSYGAALRNHFEGIGHGAFRTRAFFDHWPELRQSHCQHHYVFSLQRADAPPIIIAVLHERMDLMNRLQERLSADGLNRDRDD